MHTHAVIVPVRTGRSAKRRLAHVLDGRARELLVERMLAHVVWTLSTAGARVVILAAGDIDAPDGADDVWQDRGLGLNAALRSALRRTGTPTAIVPADLPWLTSDDVDTLLSEPGDVVVSRAADGGTNGLVLRRHIAPAFGPGSALAHAHAAICAGLRTRVVSIPGFDHDLDDAAQLSRARGRAIGLEGWND